MFPTLTALGSSHGDIPQQADEQQPAGDSFPPPLYSFEQVSLVQLTRAKDLEA